jgi:hypothetical protein
MVRGRKYVGVQSALQVCGGQSGIVTGLSRSTSASPCQLHNANSPQSTPTRYSQKKHKGAKPGELPKKQCCCVLSEGRMGRYVQSTKFDFFFSGLEVTIALSVT